MLLFFVLRSIKRVLSCKEIDISQFELCILQSNKENEDTVRLISSCRGACTKRREDSGSGRDSHYPTSSGACRNLYMAW